MSTRPLGNPCVITGGTGNPRYQKLHVLRKDEIESEECLQRLLHEEPWILPVSSIDSRIEGSIISLGREISVPSGSIDNLFISSSGYLVLVETKLRRSPEARRQVVAQILDYAYQVSQWAYQDIQGIWRRGRDQAEGNLWQAVNPEGLSEGEWVDLVSANLERGAMTLLIVSDEIHDTCRQLAELLEKNARMDYLFRLGLIELAHYHLDDGKILIVPVAVVKVQEAERAVVRVIYEGKQKPIVQVEKPAASLRNRKMRSLIDEEGFLNAVREGSNGADKVAAVRRLLDAAAESSLRVVWGSASFALKAPGPSGEILSLGVVDKECSFWFYLPWLEAALKRAWEDGDEASGRIREAYADMFSDFSPEKKKGADGRTETFVIPVASWQNRERDLVTQIERILPIVQQETERIGPQDN
jgi:hypothetical protein